MSGGSTLQAILRLIAGILLAAVLLQMPLGAPEARAEGPTLVMFDEAGCPWCLRWRREIGPAYPNTPEGKRAPLRTIDISRARTSGIALAAPVRMTPTFVLVENGREVGRITGYPGPDFFWPMLDELLRKLGPTHQGVGRELLRRASLEAALP